MKDLRTEDEIIANWKGDIDKPVVSICCITYNHEPYIEDALKGFLIQETDFPFEILIHDDASTDRTADIIREYEAKYPRLIKPIYQVENQYSQGVKISAKFNFPRSQGKYIAFCEGDDYWTSSQKLQKQTDLLNIKNDCSLCFHACQVKYMDGSSGDAVQQIKGVNKVSVFDIKDFIVGNGLNIRTVGMMIKKKALINLPDFMQKASIGDLPLQLISGIHGNYAYLPDIMAVYRRAVPGSWSEKHKTLAWKKKHIEDLNNIYRGFDQYTNFEYHALIVKRNNSWTRSVLMSAQAAGLSKTEQIEIIKPYMSILTKLEQGNFIFWLRFILGAKVVNYARKINHLIKAKL